MMRKVEIFELVRKDFGVNIALMVLNINAVHMSTKSTLKDMQFKGRYANRIKAKAKEILWEESDEDFELAFTVAMALYDYELRQTLNGFGGCVAMSLKEIVDSKNKS